MEKKDTKDLMAAVIALLALLAFFAAVVGLWAVEIPVDNRDFINFSLGSLQAFAAAAVYFYLGSSKSNRTKDETILKLSAPEEPPGAPPAPGS